MKHKRWIVTIGYLTDNGEIDNQHIIEELHEIDDLVESGPHWETITRVVISLNPRRRCIGERLTIERADTL